MEPDRPFKHVEVVDVRTGMSCKVACMACIRGHRATSCGSSSCRQKVFWTVKRPGRPSNSCSCRYRVGGTCKCNLVQSTCPHRVKGSKRSTDCRCQEQGRFCCYIDANQWEEMHALRKPRVTLFSSMEELDAAHSRTVGVSVMSPTPSLAASAHQTLSSIPGTPESTRLSNISIANMDLEPPRSASGSGKGLRFSMMGVGGPWGNDTSTPQDALQWQGLAPEMPAEYNLFNQSSQLATRNHSDSSSQHLQPMSPPPPFPYTHHLNQQGQAEYIPPITNALQEMHMAPSAIMPSEPAFDIDKLMADYVHYQFPSAICQKCGLNGCTCRNCPPVMQNADNGSWGHGCSRKHTKTAHSTAAHGTDSNNSTAAGPSKRSGCCSGDASRRSQQPQQQPSQQQQVQTSKVGAIEQESQFPLSLSDPVFTPSEFDMEDFELHSNHDPQFVELHQDGRGGPPTSQNLSEILMDQLHDDESQFRYEQPQGSGEGGCCGG